MFFCISMYFLMKVAARSAEKFKTLQFVVSSLQKWRVQRTLPPLFWSKIDCAPKVCIAVINHERLSRARECVRTSAHLGLIRWRKRDEKNCRLIGKWRSMLDVGSSFSMCILTHAWALWEDQIRKPKLKKRMLGRVRRNWVNPSIPKMEVLDASF